MEGTAGRVDQRGTFTHMKCRERHETGRDLRKSGRESRLWHWHRWLRREKASKLGKFFQPATNSQ